MGLHPRVLVFLLDLSALDVTLDPFFHVLPRPTFLFHFSSIFCSTARLSLFFLLPLSFLLVCLKFTVLRTMSFSGIPQSPVLQAARSRFFSDKIKLRVVPLISPVGFFPDPFTVTVLLVPRKALFLRPARPRAEHCLFLSFRPPALTHEQPLCIVSLTDWL